MRRKVEVLGIARVAAADTGEDLYQVNLGNIVAIPPQRRGEVPHGPGSEPPHNFGVFQMVVFLSTGAPCPYRVGTKWVLEVKPNGTLSLTPAPKD